MAKRGFTFNVSETASEMIQTHFPANEIRQAQVMYVSPDKAPDGQHTVAIVWDDEEEAVPPAELPEPYRGNNAKIWVPRA